MTSVFITSIDDSSNYIKLLSTNDEVFDILSAAKLKFRIKKKGKLITNYENNSHLPSDRYTWKDVS